MIRDIVASAAEASQLELTPLLVIENVASFFDAHALGKGELRVSPIGEGRSNFTFLIERGGDRYVLRRPPRPPFPRSAHDVIREARLQLALEPLGVRVPRVRAICEDESVLGVPFYVLAYVDGYVVTDRLPPPLDCEPKARQRLAQDLTEVLAEIHEVDVDEPAVAAFRRPGSYLERQLQRFSELWPLNATRELPAVERAARLLAERLPQPLPATVVHGDFRLGNMIVDRDDPSRIAAAVDWEMGAIGDPRADLGYLVATYSEPGGSPSFAGGSPATTHPGFPSRRELVEAYAVRTGRPVDGVEWFVAFALWKAAVFCEAIYGRYLRGELAAGDERAAVYEAAVPAMAEGALESLESRSLY